MNQGTGDLDGDQPIYRRIAAQIRAEITSGTLAEEDQVMSTNQYAAFHRVNPATVGKAFGELVDEGLLYKRRGLGMFVRPGARQRLQSERRARFGAVFLLPALEEADRLGIPLDDVVAELTRLAASGANGQRADPGGGHPPGRRPSQAGGER
jgi:GntR family transcriptional regulator